MIARRATRAMLLAAAVATAFAGVAAGCSADGTAADPPPEPPATLPPAEAGGSDVTAAADAADGAPDAACADCVYYPSSCAGATFCPVTIPVQPALLVTGIGGTSSSDVWASGAKGTLLHHDGSSWAMQNAPAVTLTQVWPHTSLDVIAGSTLSLLYASPAVRADAGAGDAGDGGDSGDGGDGGAPPFPRALLRPVDFDDANINGIFAAPGATWTWLATTPAPYLQQTLALSIKRVRRRGATALFDVQSPFECVEPCLPITRIHGSSKDDLWAVGELGRVYRISAAEAAAPVATEYDSRFTSTLYGVWAAGPEDVWAVGQAGAIVHYTGAMDHRFEVVASPVATTLRAVWGTSGSDVWAVGDDAAVVHYDGASWTRVTIGKLAGRPDLHGVWAASSSKVWIVGKGVLLERGGAP